MKSKLLAIAVLTVFLVTGCSQRIVDFTIISTKNVDISKGAQFERGRDRVEGTDMIHIILSIPTGVPNLKEAIDKALESVPGAVALLDGVVYSKAFYIVLYGQTSYIVEGTPLIDPSMAANSEYEGGYYSLDFDRNGKLKGKTKLTEEEYTARKDDMIKDGAAPHSLN